MRKTPSPITILAMIVLFYMILNGIRLLATILNWKILILYGSFPGPDYMIIVSLVWIFIGSLLMLCLIKRYSKTQLLITLFAGLYSTWFWIDRITFQHQFHNFLISLVGTSIMLLLIILLLKRQGTKIYFQRER